MRSRNSYGNRMQFSQPRQYQGGFEGITSKRVPLMRILRHLYLFRKFLLLRWKRGGRRGCIIHVMPSGVRVMLFLIEEVEEDSITVEEIVEKEEEDPRKIFMDQEPEISLNAIIGTHNPKTIRMIGIIKSQQVMILIYSGSTHKFVDEQVANMIGIKSTNKDVIKVRIVNG
jgi:hypothetical protein